MRKSLNNLHLFLSWRCLIPVLLLICHSTLDVQAAELGDIRVHSWLGRQLKASVPLMGMDARGSEERCFKGSLINLNHELVSTLKVSLQHSSKASVLLLSGGNAVDEPAAMVRLENVCGTGSSREYAVLLDPVSEAPAVAAPAVIPLPETGKEEAIAPPTRITPAPEKSVASARTENPPDFSETTRRGTQAAQKLPKMPANAEAIPPITGMLKLKMAAMLAKSYPNQILHAAHSSPRHGVGEILREPMQPDTSSQPRLKLDRSLAKLPSAAMEKRALRNSSSTQSDRAGQDTGKDSPISQTAFIAGALSFLFIFGAAIWIVVRMREMKGTTKPWIPNDLLLDTSSNPSSHPG